MSFRTIRFHPGPRVSTIVLDRPPLNIINLEMMDELDAAWTEIEAIGSAVVVVSGAGPKGFSAGVDIADHVPERVDAMLDKMHRIIRRIVQSDRISIAAIHGHTLGGGAELAMVCDFVIAANDARLGQPEIALACYPPVAAAYLPRAIGAHRAAEIVLLGEPIAAAEAERFGLVNRVVPAGDLQAATDRLVEGLLRHSSAVLALTKRALREGVERPFLAALERSEQLYKQELTATEDMREGIQAFLEKRPPNWKNR